MITIEENKPYVLFIIGNLIHDSIFYVSEISYDSELLTLIMQSYVEVVDFNVKKRVFRLFKRPVTYRHKATLTINNVVKYKIEDSANIDSYSFSVFHYDKNNRLLDINADPDLIIKLVLSELSIKLEISDEYVEV